MLAPIVPHLNLSKKSAIGQLLSRLAQPYAGAAHIADALSLRPL